MDNRRETGSVWWMFAIAAGAVAFGAALAPGADTWWELATIAVMAVLALVLVVAGVSSLIGRRRDSGGPE